jgi:molybdenum-dependent DNA-binding transcriptional regulator ModE
MTTLRTLECLVALVDHGSVSAAAAALHMSQPALSHQIASLEKELGALAVSQFPNGLCGCASTIDHTGRKLACFCAQRGGGGVVPGAPTREDAVA